MKNISDKIEFRPQRARSATKSSSAHPFAFLRLLRGLDQTDGAEIAEAALVLPIVFTFLLGIVWFGRAFQIYSTITQAAQRGAITAARSTCATCPGGFPNETVVENSVFSVMDTSGVNHTAIIMLPPAGLQYCAPPVPPGGCTTTGNSVTICRSVLLNPSTEDPPPPQQCGTIVSFQYPFQMNLPFTSLNMQRIMLKAQAQSRMEN